MTARARRIQPSHLRPDLKVFEDNEIVRAFLSGDEGAFKELVERYQTHLLGFVYRAIGDRERAEDIVQETFLRVYRHIRHFDQTKKFSSWIYTIASNLTKNELHDQMLHPSVTFSILDQNRHPDENLFEARDTKSTPDRAYEKQYAYDLVMETVSQLTVDHKIVFTLRELRGLSYEAIGEIIDCPPGTVRSRLSRARAAFKALAAHRID